MLFPWLHRRGQCSVTLRKALLTSVFKDIIDLYTLLDPDLVLEDDQRHEIFTQLRMNIEVLDWFEIDTSEFERQLEVGPIKSDYKIRLN